MIGRVPEPEVNASTSCVWLRHRLTRLQWKMETPVSATPAAGSIHRVTPPPMLRRSLLNVESKVPIVSTRPIFLPHFHIWQSSKIARVFDVIKRPSPHQHTSASLTFQLHSHKVTQHLLMTGRTWVSRVIENCLL